MKIWGYVRELEASQESRISLSLGVSLSMCVCMCVYSSPLGRPSFPSYLFGESETVP